MKAFQININNQLFDYRIGSKLNLDEIKLFFKNKNYFITKFIPQERHVNALLNNNFFLKLSTSKGISIVTENEAAWNNAVSSLLFVPKIHDRGYYKNDYFYMIMDYFDAPLATSEVVKANLNEIIDLSEKVMNLKISMLPADKYNLGKNHHEKFTNKVKSHLDSIPEKIRTKYNLSKLLDFIIENTSFLKCTPRHGDFAPWHLITNRQSLTANHFFLIDGEHAMSQGVEYYDISYFIQRVFSVWKNPELAKKIYEKLLNRGYSKNKLKTVLFARAIGGFLDESLVKKPNYKIHEEFKNWTSAL